MSSQEGVDRAGGRAAGCEVTKGQVSADRRPPAGGEVTLSGLSTSDDHHKLWEYQYYLSLMGETRPGFS